MEQQRIKIEAQIKALTDRINNGKYKNKYALSNKISALKKKLSNQDKVASWNKYLAQ
jgi:hypothetical protein